MMNIKSSCGMGEVDIKSRLSAYATKAWERRPTQSSDIQPLLHYQELRSKTVL